METMRRSQTANLNMGKLRRMGHTHVTDNKHYLNPKRGESVPLRKQIGTEDSTPASIIQKSDAITVALWAAGSIARSKGRSGK
ncbi:MAG TPA: hypothetical protein VND15_03480 [Candidatus Acidoferrales bacterium]|nr:hypothetical protein [Candidatus Acidoferrales bacterium]